MYRMAGTAVAAPAPPPAPAPATSPVPSAPIAGVPIHINAGGSAYTDANGVQWGADSGFTDGNAYAVSSVIAGTAAQPVYQTSRWNSSALHYQFTLPNGSYLVNLKFAEAYYTAAGQRMF